MVTGMSLNKSLDAAQDGDGNLMNLGRGEDDLTCGGGSSSVFKNAFHALVDSMWTSSTMKICTDLARVVGSDSCNQSCYRRTVVTGAVDFEDVHVRSGGNLKTTRPSEGMSTVGLRAEARLVSMHCRALARSERLSFYDPAHPVNRRHGPRD